MTLVKITSSLNTTLGMLEEGVLGYLQKIPPILKPVDGEDYFFYPLHWDGECIRLSKDQFVIAPAEIEIKV